MFSKNVNSSYRVISCLPFTGKFILNLESMSPFVFITVILKAFKCHDLFVSKGFTIFSYIQQTHDTQLTVSSTNS
jgi:hypothetical protein